MKRFVVTLLVLIILTCCCACTNDDVRKPVNFYYLSNPVDYNTSSGVVSPEIRDGEGYENDLASILSLYLNGPESEEYASPFPNGTEINRLTLDLQYADIEFNSAFSSLTGHDLTIACVCMSKTVIELTQCQAVRISAVGSQLNGNDYIEMTEENFLFIDNLTSTGSLGG